MYDRHELGTRSPQRHNDFNPMAIDSMLNDDVESSHEPLQSKYRHRGKTLEETPCETKPQILRRRTDSCVMSPIRPLLYYPEQARPPPLPCWQAHQAPSPTETGRASGVRASRPKYEEQQGFWIWYHRTDLGEPWDQVLQAFKLQFGQSRPKGGLQCKFYRLLDTWNVEKVRAQTRHTHENSRDRVGAYGVVQRTNKRFEWMRPEHYHAPCLPKFRHNDRAPTSDSACPGCPDCVR